MDEATDANCSARSSRPATAAPASASPSSSASSRITRARIRVESRPGAGQPVHAHACRCDPHARVPHKWLNNPTVLSSEGRAAAPPHCLQSRPVGVRRPLGWRTPPPTSSSTTRCSATSSRARSAPSSAASSSSSTRASRTGAAWPRSCSTRPRTPSVKTSRCIDPDGNPVIKVPVAYADVHIQELVVSLAKTALTLGHHFYLTLHFPQRLHPVGLGGHRADALDVGPREHRRQHRRRDVVAQEVGVVRRRLHHPRRRSRARRPRLRHGLLRPRRQAELVGQARRRPRQGRPQVLLVDKELATQRGARTSSSACGTSTRRSRRCSSATINSPRRAHRRRVRRARQRSARICSSPPTDAPSAPACAPTAGSSTPTRERPGVELHLDVVDGRGPLALLPPPLSTWLSGNPYAHIDINGLFTHPVIDGEAHAIDANLEGIKFTDGNAKLHFDSGKLTLHPADGKLARGRAAADIDLDMPTGVWSALVTLKDVDSAEIPKLPKAAAAELAGRLEGKVHLAGNYLHRAERIELTRLTADLTRSKPGGHLPRTIKLAGNGEFTPALITLRGVSASGEGVTIGANGTIDPRSGRLDAGVSVDAAGGSSLFARWGAPGGLHLDWLHASGRVAGPMLRPTVAMHASASNVSYARRTLDKLEADLSLRARHAGLVRSARHRPRHVAVRLGRARPLRRRPRSPEEDADGAGAADRARALRRRAHRLALGHRRRRRRRPARRRARAPARARLLDAAAPRDPGRRLHRRRAAARLRRRRRQGRAALVTPRARRLRRRLGHGALERRHGPARSAARLSARRHPVGQDGAGRAGRHALGRHAHRRHHRSPGAGRHPLARRLQGARGAPRQGRPQARSQAPTRSICRANSSATSSPSTAG